MYTLYAGFIGESGDMGRKTAVKYPENWRKSH
jgi:hypothetical protein